MVYAKQVCKTSWNQRSQTNVDSIRYINLIYIYSLYIYIYIYYHITCESTCDTQSSSASNQGDNKVSVDQGGTATPCATKQLLPPDSVLKYIYIYIYTPDQLKQTLHWTFVYLHFRAVCDLKMRLLSAVGVIATVSWFCVITREWWLHVHCIHVEMPSISVIYSVGFPSV